MDHQTQLFEFGRDLLAGLLTGLLAVLMLRPARVRGVSLIHYEDGPLVRAEVGLEYSRGIRPRSMIINLRSAENTSSTTVSGAPSIAEVPLQHPPERPCRVTATAVYRILGLLRTDTRTFEA